jgi:hypothetical protein
MKALPRCMILAAVLLQPPAAMAQSFVTFMSSSTGDNLNDCSRANPCSNLAGTLAKTIAQGTIVVLDANSIIGSIDKSVSIVGEGTFMRSTGIQVDVAAGSRVNLIGVAAEGNDLSSGGIRIRVAGTVHLRNCSVKGFSVNAQSSGIVVEPTGAAEVFVTNCHIADNHNGILVMPTGTGSATVVLDNVQLQNNAVGLRTLGTLPSRVTVANSVVSGNRNTGLLVGGTNATLRLTNSVVTGNNRGLHSGGGAQIISYGNNLIGGNAIDGTPTSTLPLR